MTDDLKQLALAFVKEVKPQGGDVRIPLRVSPDIAVSIIRTRDTSIVKN